MCFLMMAIYEMFRSNGVGSDRSCQSVYVMSIGLSVSLSQVNHSQSVRKLCLSVSQWLSVHVRQCQSFGLSFSKSLSVIRSASH